MSSSLLFPATQSHLCTLCLSQEIGSLISLCGLSLPLLPIGHCQPDRNAWQIPSPEVTIFFFYLFLWRWWHYLWFLLNITVCCLSAPDFHFLVMKSCLLQLSLHLHPPCKEVASAIPVVSPLSTHSYSSGTDWHKTPENNPPCSIPHMPIVFHT